MLGVCPWYDTFSVHLPFSGTKTLNEPFASVCAANALSPQAISTFTPWATGLPESVMVPMIFPAKHGTARPKMINSVKARLIVPFLQNLILLRKQSASDRQS